MKCLIRFANEYFEFRIPELHSCAQVCGVKISHDVKELKTEDVCIAFLCQG